MKVIITKFHPMVSHEVGEVVELEDSFAEKHIEAGFAEAAKGGKSAKVKSIDGIGGQNDINEINESEDHLSNENHGELKGAEAQDADGNVIETKLVDGKHVEVESTSSVPSVGVVAETKPADLKTTASKTTK